MLDLVYPVDSVAPVAKGTKADRSAEMLPVVDSLGLVTGQASRSVCHNGSKLLHPVVHMHVLNRFGQIYLQRRSAEKDLYPLFWDTAVGGHVSYGEYLGEALYREASEELGLRCYNPYSILSYVFESGTEKELVSVFAAVGNFEIHPDNYEVSDGRYWSVDEIERNIGTSVFTPNFEMEYKMVKDKLLALL